MNDILESVCEYKVDYMCRAVWKGCKCEPQLGHCEGQGEKMPFMHLKI